MAQKMALVAAAAALSSTAQAEPHMTFLRDPVLRGVRTGVNGTGDDVELGSACSQYSGDDDNMCSLCTSQSSLLGDCFWCSADNSCHDRGSAEFPASCYADGCVSHSTATGCVGSCAAGHVSGFDVPLAQCMLGIANATYYVGKTLPQAFAAIGIDSSQYQIMTDTKLDTQGFVIAHPDANAITISFRGTELTAANEKLDIDCLLDNFQTQVTDNQPSVTSGWDVADGFSNAYLSLRDQMETNFQWALGQVGPSPKVYITGHSLGAAMATVAAADFALGNATSLVGNVEVITFAAPRSGNTAYATGISQLLPNWWSVQNFFDQIPHLPLQVQGYRHVTNIVIVGPNDGNIVEVTPPTDDEHFNITANPISFHYTSAYMSQLNALDGAASGPTNCPTDVLS
eukprot:INCI861.1.p1 GENE.INCI861.1~~INCI861.1.p1  ORF type:complete len:400 (+),score=67.66 INCI861.1:95-1294(+)